MDIRMSDLKLPIDFENKMKSLLKDEWDAFIDCYSNQKYQALRINSMKRCRGDWSLDETSYEKEVLKEAGISLLEPVPWAKHGYYYDLDARPGKHIYHEMGLYYIQEPSAMSAVGLLDVQPGEFVLDLCSAPGGKATQIADALKGEGLLVANEIHPARSKILAQNIERMGIGNALVTNEDPQGMSAHFAGFFDKILVDAPCSGEGMFRKNPEAMEEWSLEQVLVCADRQAEILEHAAIMLKTGGRMVYSTCTFAPEEDEMSMVNFLKKHPEFKILEVEAPYFSPARADWGCIDEEEFGIASTFRLWPHKLHGEGHYVAVLEKKGNKENACYEYCDEAYSESYKSKAEIALEKSQKKKKGKGKKQDMQKADGVLNKEQITSLESFYAESLLEEVAEKLKEKELVLFGDQLYALPTGIHSLAGLKVERAGLHIGTFKKNRFEPSHALALYLHKDEVKQYITLKNEDARALGYFKGEGFFVNPGELICVETGMCKEVTEVSEKKGFCLMCVDGYSAGFVKLANGQAKNHYPKGLRKDLVY